MRAIDLPQGTIHVTDTDPDGPPEAVVLLHGLLVDGGLWDGVVERLRGRHRCVVPDLPLGAHRTPLAPGAERTPRGVARLVADLLEALELRDVTLVGNDTGGAIAQLVAAHHPERIGRLVLTPCDTYDDFLPRFFRPLQWLAHVPGALYALAQPLRVHRARELPVAFGLLTRDGLPRELGDRWTRRFLGDRGVRRDVTEFLKAISPQDTNEAARILEAFHKPVLLAWAPGDRFFKLRNAERLAAALPDARIERIEGASTFVSIDEPGRTAELIGSFAREPDAVRAV